MSSLRIGMVCYPTYGGSGVIAAELGSGLARRGHEVHFICLNRPMRLPRGLGAVNLHLVNVISYPLFEYPPYTLALASKIHEIVISHSLDLVHAHYAVPHSTAAHLAQQMEGGEKTRVITTLHGTDVRLVGLDPSLRSITRFSIDCNDGVTAVSRYLAEETVRGLGIRRPIRVIPNFVDTARFRHCFSPRLRARFAEGGEAILAHVSNFRKAKRAPDVIHIFARVNARRPSRLLMIGNGPDYAICQELVKELALGGRVHFLDFVDDVERLLSISDLCLFPSELESFGLAALEALSCQVPVITSDAGGFAELIPEGEVGYLRPVGDIEGMAERALTLLQDEVLRRRMGAAGRRLALERYRSEVVIGLYEGFYREVLGGRREEEAARAAT